MTDLIVSVLGFFEKLVGLLPEISIGDSTLGSVQSAFTMVVEFISVSSFIVPLNTVFTIIGIVYGFRLAKFAVFCGNWVIRRIADIIP